VGHDLTAAAAMGRTYPVVRILARQGTSPGDVLERLDDACGLLPEARFATVGYAEFSPATMRLQFACAGHPPPLLVDESGARFLWEGRSTPVAIRVGRRPYPPRASSEVHLIQPARLLWFTDGLIERPGAPLEQELERLRVLAGELDLADSPDEWCTKILAAMVVDHVIEDDVVLLCAELKSAERGSSVN
jgi:serine phosphatase RsbU (regulator of sigma subunit)